MEGPQPDFGLIATGFTDLGEQFARCVHLPALDGGQRILQVLQRLEGKIDGLDRRLQAVESRQQAMETRQLSNEQNAVARLENSMVTRPEQPLTALKAVVTNTDIAGFPETLHAIQSMTGTQLNTVLTALGQSVAGTVAEKKRRLKITVGVVVQHV